MEKSFFVCFCCLGCNGIYFYAVFGFINEHGFYIFFRKGAHKFFRGDFCGVDPCINGCSAKGFAKCDFCFFIAVFIAPFFAKPDGCGIFRGKSSDFIKAGKAELFAVADKGTHDSVNKSGSFCISELFYRLDSFVCCSHIRNGVHIEKLIKTDSKTFQNGGFQFLKGCFGIFFKDFINSDTAFKNTVEKC